MGKNSNPVWITGIGLLSSLGEGVDDHWQAMNAAKPLNVDTERFAPYPVHALGEVDWATQISRRDKRQMEPWQQIGTYTAGLALEDAGAKEDEELCGRMDMIIAAGGGERDTEVDSAILTDARSTNDKEALLSERLSNDLRPTLFLAQLSNLLAGNISIVHKVTGSSRTFMGEEGAGISAIKTAHARISSGQSDIVLVGGAFNGEREDMLLLFELGHYLAKGNLTPVWSRGEENAGFNQGSIGAFLVLESKAHAEKRGVAAYGELESVVADHGKRANNGTSLRLKTMVDKLNNPTPDAIISAATGAAPITSEEATWLDTNFPDTPVRAFATMTGHGVETQFPLGIALAAIALKKGDFYAPLETKEKKANGDVNSIMVTTLGHYRSEGLGIVKPVEA